MKITWTIFGEPVAKARPKFFSKGKRTFAYTPAKTKQAEENFLMQSIKFRPPKPIETAIILQVKIFQKIPRSFSKRKSILATVEEIRPITRPDLDNYLKLICDALNGIFWKDDSQIISCKIEKYYSETPRIEVIVEEK